MLNPRVCLYFKPDGAREEEKREGDEREGPERR
jgi:hypothetical protein